MNKIATKLQIGAAAAAIAAAATLMPMPAAQADPVAPAPTAPMTLETNVLFQRDLVSMQLSCGLLGLICAGNRADLSPHQVFFSLPFLGVLLGDFAICSLGISVKQGSYGSLSISRGSSC
jgi:hypothetical protein